MSQNFGNGKMGMEITTRSRICEKGVGTQLTSGTQIFQPRLVQLKGYVLHRSLGYKKK